MSCLLAFEWISRIVPENEPLFSCTHVSVKCVLLLCACPDYKKNKPSMKEKVLGEKENTGLLGLFRRSRKSTKEVCSVSQSLSWSSLTLMSRLLIGNHSYCMNRLSRAPFLVIQSRYSASICCKKISPFLLCMLLKWTGSCFPNYFSEQGRRIWVFLWAFKYQLQTSN